MKLFHIHRDRTTLPFAAFTIFFSMALLLAGCGGGGGGGGGGGDATAPTIAFTTPASSASYDADPDDLPATVAVRYSDAGGINRSSFAITFRFQNVTFDISSLFSTTSSTASSSSDTSPLYWTTISKYNATSLSEGTPLQLYGVSSGSSGVLNLLDIDSGRGLLVAAATSRNKLVVFNTSTGASIREISLPAMPSVIATCPDYSKVYVAFSSTNTTYANSVYAYYYTASGSSGTAIGMGDTPMAMALNKTTSTAYVVFSNSTTMKTIDCSDNTVTTATLQNIPQRITTDSDSSGRLFFAGGIGVDKGIYRRTSAGVEDKLVTLSTLPEDLVYDSETNRFFAADYGNDKVDIYDVSNGTTVAQPSVGDQPFSLVLDQSANRVFVLNKGSDSVSYINTSTSAVDGSISLDSDPVALVADSSGGFLYVLQNIWEISASSNGTINTSIKDTSGNTGSASLAVTIDPVSTGGPTNPQTPDG